ncbi:delta-1-pyrroline-5-carboxylate dehydrogenase, mitochondrial-like [Varroa destructor]|uniref:Multifunctional fusion protein n=1 Tax=Varroa destructor TaxID=109461 RepID=A0A7M7JLF8_VARDE|nr:delta-1-pyrroline-5-carboxylate dehydrogenase, mitochondrial-like [Varroa destructor]XP_022653988.1 delta-1-pyrroline-5-carboxylate dehydrogenase, mitochondrial-like [Varroa destructor]XP_022653989.1 delta-1-pyrroline-5-carboxylate dehydrogenase, mitochondrial-like [Varroa destructor]
MLQSGGKILRAAIRQSSTSRIAVQQCRNASALQLSAAVPEFEVTNEPILDYLPGSPERQQLEAALNKWKDATTDVPIIIGGKEYRTDVVRTHTAPFDHTKTVAKFSWADPNLIQKAIEDSLSVRVEWERTPLAEKIKIFLRAADLVANKYRADLLATTMIGQGKTIFQAEIDAAAELADFLRFNAYFAKELVKYQPISPDPSVTINQYRHRGIEGFFTAISPFNFSAIGGNLATAPSLMGNVVLWKPSDSAVLSNYLIYKILLEAGLPPGVVNFIPADGKTFGDVTSAHPELAGVNFTGSVPTFRTIWRQVSSNLEKYKNLPRILGECGGKNFHFAHSSADIDTLVAQTTRSAFEFSGQKCSACERLYVPDTIWPKVKEGMLEAHKKLKLGSPLDFSSFTSAVIDQTAFKKISNFIEYGRAKQTLLAGGETNSTKGWFIEPTIFQTQDPDDRLMKEEIFGPVVTVYVYDAKDTLSAMQKALQTSPFGLTAAIFAREQAWLEKSTEYLKYAGGNFYVNDKSTGAVVGQQPFGGSRISGTNDKPGGPHYLLRFSSPQVIKQTLTPLTEIDYAYMRP